MHNFVRATAVASEATYVTYIIFPRPEILGAWVARLTLDNGAVRDCKHKHSREDLAVKCGKQLVKRGDSHYV